MTVRLILLILGLLHLANGAWMLAAPDAWYAAVPGVTLTGPMNHHFVEDVGLAFAASGAGLMCAVRAGVVSAAFALAGAVWPMLHALLHIWGWIAHGFPRAADVAFSEAVGVVAIGLGICACCSQCPQTGSALMLRRWIHRQIAKLERRYRYDGTYMHEVADASVPAFFKFGFFQIMSMHREAVPKEAWFAARIAGALSEDCGPCTQLVVDMALRESVSPSSVAALLRGDIDAAGADAAFGFRYGMAVAKNAPDAATFAEEAERRYGKRGLVSLAYAVASARVYPTVKRGLGHGAVCAKITVANDTVAINRAA